MKGSNPHTRVIANGWGLRLKQSNNKKTTLVTSLDLNSESERKKREVMKVVVLVVMVVVVVEEESLQNLFRPRGIIKRACFPFCTSFESLHPSTSSKRCFYYSLWLLYQFFLPFYPSQMFQVSFYCYTWYFCLPFVVHQINCKLD